MRVPLGVLDQSPVISGHSPARAIAETVSLARLAEELGYRRYWLAEHHAIAALADPSPEILVSRVASATSRSTALALADGEYPGAEHMPRQVQDLIGFLDRSLPAGHPYVKVKAQPAGDTSPEIWLLGSSDYGGALAAQLGLRFAFAHFISAFGGEAVARAYRDHYQASEREPRPWSLVCVFVICAKSRSEAERLAASIDLRRLHMAKGIDAPVPTLEEAKAYRSSPQERAYIEQQRSRLVHGDSGEVREKLLELKEKFAADELMVITITGDYESRRTSYRLVAEAFA